MTELSPTARYGTGAVKRLGNDRHAVAVAVGETVILMAPPCTLFCLVFQSE